MKSCQVLSENKVMCWACVRACVCMRVCTYSVSGNKYVTPCENVPDYNTVSASLYMV